MSLSVMEQLEKMKREYEVKNIEAIENRWGSADASKKAKQWPQRFLSETVLSQIGAGREAIAVKLDDWGRINIRRACRQMGLHCEIPTTWDYFSNNGVIVIGSTEQAVRSKSAELQREQQRAALREEQEHAEREQRAHKKLYTQLDLAKSKGKDSKGEWDVSGTWKINCPYFEEQWGGRSREGRSPGLYWGCILKIQLTAPGPDGLLQMFASFDFMALTGIMRFVNTEAPEVLEEARNTNSEDGSDGCYEGPEKEISTPAHFLFPRTSLPSLGKREFSFRWRGEETGEGEIQLDSDKVLCSLTFESPNALTGMFISDLAPKSEFRGFKEEAAQSPSKINDLNNQDRPLHMTDPGYEWNARSQAAWEAAARRRWGRW